MQRVDALVIGAGPAGSTAALELARAGLSVAIVEKAAFPRRKVCGEYISATSWPLLEALGLGDLALRAGPEVSRVGLFAGETSVSAPMPAPDNAHAWGRAVRRDLLDAALLERAMHAGALALQPARVLRLSRAGEAPVATVSFAGNAAREIEARIVIAAHGSWEASPCRESARERHRDSDLLGFKARFRAADLERGLMPLVLFPGGYGGLVHVDATEVSLSCCIRRDALRACRDSAPGRSAGDALLAHLMRSCRGVRETLGGATQACAWLSAGPIQPGTRALFDDGVFFVGNAAAEAHPLVAEGISMAIQSASLASACLRETGSLSADAVREAGRRYTARWRRHFAARVLASSAFARLTMSPLTGAASIALLRSMPRALTLGALWSGKAHDLQPTGARG